MHFVSAIICAFAVSCFAHGVQDTVCPIEPYELLVPPGLQTNEGYGASMVVDGDWLFVGAPGRLSTPLRGTVYVFRLEDNVYTLHQHLLAAGGVGSIPRFGFSLAVDGDVLVIGAENDQEITQSNPDAWGAAYVFRLQNDVWIQEHKLFAFGPGEAQRFGYSVAVNGDIIVVGARTVVNDGPVNRGAAYIFQYDGTTWTQQQRLTADIPTSSDLFGTSLAMTSDLIAIGSPQNDDQATNAGAVFVFFNDGGFWVQQEKLYAFDAMASDGFGASLSLLKNAVVVGAPQSDPLGSLSGAAYVFDYSDGQWSRGVKLVASDGSESDRFGRSVAISGETILVGAPTKDFGLGAVYVYRRKGTDWVEERYFTCGVDESLWGYGPFACWLSNPQPSSWPDLTNSECGKSVTISPIGLLAGATFGHTMCWDYPGPASGGAAYLFANQFEFAECNNNGVQDKCDPEPDCNGNHVPDSCDLANGTSSDCNNNQIPDECETPVRYFLNTTNATQFYAPLPSSGNSDFIWLNQFKVKPGGQFISHIALQASPFLPRDTPIKVMVYADPNGDGNPNDAALLAVTENTSLAHDYIDPSVAPWVLVPIAPTYVGEPGTLFFVGAVLPTLYLLTENEWAPAGGAPGYQRSWRAFAPPGQADIYDLTNNASPVQLWGASPFVLRALASDCNGNGMWDACDIAAGTLLDTNQNGIPDSCDVPDCFFADIAPTGGDGEVNVLDLLLVISNWGFCGFGCPAICPGDTNDDCTVNVVDLLAVINGWGPCQR